MQVKNALGSDFFKITRNILCFAPFFNIQVKKGLGSDFFKITGNILCFAPSFNIQVKNKLGCNFFNILKKYFSPTKELYKIFNKKYFKMKYSSMSNIFSKIHKINKNKFIKKSPLRNEELPYNLNHNKQTNKQTNKN